MDVSTGDIGLVAVLLSAGGALAGSVIWIGKQVSNGEARCMKMVTSVESELRSQIEALRASSVRREEMRDMEARLNTRADRQDQVLDRIEGRVAELAQLAELTRQSYTILQELALRAHRPALP